MLRPVTVAAMFAVPALALSACAPNEPTATEPGSAPPVWTGSPAPAVPPGAGQGQEGGERLTAPLRTADGTQVGTADFDFADDYATVTVRITTPGEVEPGFHGMHLHSVGKCEANSMSPSGAGPGDFLSSGSHLHLQGDGEGHPASGDLTPLQVREDGLALLVTTSDQFTAEDLTRDGGSALIIHDRPDNFANIPPERYQQVNGAPPPDEVTLTTGDAGDRVVCGVISAG